MMNFRIFQRLSILILTLVLSLFLAELFVARVIKFPFYTLGTQKYRIHDSLGQYNTLTLRPPYYKFWSVEGGNKVYNFNNQGLPGVDVDLSKERHNIVVLGSSFIESMNMPDNAMSTAVFQKILKDRQRPFNVVNLGSSGHDPYVLWFRLRFFQSRFKPDYVILVVDPSSFSYLNNRWTDSLSFSSPDNSPVLLNQSFYMHYTSIPRKYSSLINLYIQGFAAKGNNDEAIIRDKSIRQIKKDTSLTKFEQCISQFKQHYGDKFAVVSIIPDTDINLQLGELCDSNECLFFSNNEIMQPANRVLGKGHLNAKGNTVLGKFLYQSFNTMVDDQKNLNKLESGQ